jgi:hypothetical protein
MYVIRTAIHQSLFKDTWNTKKMPIMAFRKLRFTQFHASAEKNTMFALFWDAKQHKV